MILWEISTTSEKQIRLLSRRRITQQLRLADKLIANGEALKSRLSYTGRLFDHTLPDSETKDPAFVFGSDKRDIKNHDTGTF